MAIINSFKDLIVYQKAYTLAMEIFELSKAFPKEEKVKQPRKFKTHSEKKEFLKNQPKSNK